MVSLIDWIKIRK